MSRTNWPVEAKRLRRTPSVRNRARLTAYRAAHIETSLFIYVKHKSPLGSAVIVEPPTRIEVEGLWESPEEVIGFYSNTDNQDLELPFPNEMMQFIVADILKTEFNIQPKDVEVTN